MTPLNKLTILMVTISCIAHGAIIKKTPSPDLKKIEKGARTKMLFGKKINGIINHHPTGIKFNKKIDLPLSSGSVISCRTCHKAHSGKNKQSKFLRKEYRQLCATCHPKQNKPHTNHMDFTGKMKVSSCSNCHYMHFSNKKLTRLPDSQLCLGCHIQEKQSHTTLRSISKLSKIKNYHLTASKITCSTCHTPHSKTENIKYLRDKDHIQKLCANCHGGKARKVLEKYHHIMRLKGAKKGQVEIAI